MKASKYLLLALFILLSTGRAAWCQDTTIRYNQYYSFEQPKKGCALQLKIVAAPKLKGTLMLNNHSYSGYVEPNNKNKEIVYNFYCNINGKKKLILLQFSSDEDCYKATIINQEYLPLFKPCFDEKYIVLRSCE